MQKLYYSMNLPLHLMIKILKWLWIFLKNWDNKKVL